MSGQEVIVTFGDRRNSGFCLKCGATLIQPYNDYQCCSECTEFIEGCLQKLAIKQKKSKSKKVGGMAVVDKRNVMRQVAPIGKPVK